MKDYLLTISEVLTNLYGIRISNRVSHQLRDGITMGTFVSRGTRYDWYLKGATLEVTPCSCEDCGDYDLCNPLVRTPVNCYLYHKPE
jgi:hypothetical protein